jgi:hypothetical protein
MTPEQLSFDFDEEDELTPMFAPAHRPRYRPSRPVPKRVKQQYTAVAVRPVKTFPRHRAE